MRHLCYALSLLGGLLLTGPTWANADAKAPEMNSMEQKWLDAATPVLDFARDQGLPIDVVVVQERGPDDVPLSMGVRQRRCKLVLAVRGDTEAEATLEGVPLDRQALLIAAMTAHEIAHCWRYAQGDWHKLPAGFIEPAEVVEGKELRAKKSAMRATRREEGFADLVALAWTRRMHPEAYAEVHTWLEGVRRHQPLSGSFHDTRIWLDLAKRSDSFNNTDSPFEQVQALWTQGLDRDEPTLAKND